MRVHAVVGFNEALETGGKPFDTVRFNDTNESDTNFFDVGSEERERGERCGTDGKAFARCRRRVPERVERVRAFAHLRVKTGHFGVPAGVVGDGTVSVRRERDSERGEHPDRRDADPVETETERFCREDIGERYAFDQAEAARREDKRKHNRDNDRNHGNAGGKHPDADTGNDNRRGTGFRGFRDALRRFIRVRGVVFCRLSDDNPGEQTDDDRERNADPVRNVEKIKDAECCRNDERGGNVHAATERAEEVFHRRAFLRAHEVNSENRKQNTDCRDEHRSHDCLNLHGNGKARIRVEADKCRRAESRRSENRTAVGFVKVRTHTGDVADVVAHVVRDGGGIARVVFRDSGFDFADEVRADVRRLRVNTAADAREQRLRRSTHAEGQHRGRDEDHLVRSRRRFVNPMRAAVENNRPKGNIEEPETDNDQAHNRARAERDAEPGVERFLRGVCRARARVSCRLHSEEAGETGEEAARQKRYGNDRILQSFHCENSEQNCQNHEDDSDDFVLLFEIRHRARADVLSDLFHGRRAFIAFHHLAIKMRRECESHNRSCGNCPEDGLVNDVCLHKREAEK